MSWKLNSSRVLTSTCSSSFLSNLRNDRIQDSRQFLRAIYLLCPRNVLQLLQLSAYRVYKTLQMGFVSFKKMFLPKTDIGSLARYGLMCCDWQVNPRRVQRNENSFEKPLPLVSTMFSFPKLFANPWVSTTQQLFVTWSPCTSKYIYPAISKSLSIQ